MVFLPLLAVLVFWNVLQHNIAINDTVFITWGEHKVKDSRRSEMSSKLLFWDKSSFLFESAISRSESGITSRYFEISSSSLNYSLIYWRKKKLLFLACPGFESIYLWPVRSDVTLSWAISRLLHLDPMYFVMWTNGFNNFALVSGQDWKCKFVKLAWRFGLFQLFDEVRRE